ncbi:hypothetical protein O6H91_09G109300 [Diphasiastrum complanatum]|uniref:Uncharacterized protein n=1 Tax=Diphasiastrum complanatum TaxID=34168 RepID=A0ACC2CSY2_DIPCM|nr:hypothetical protein O6H91_09G109300 [Diphasiastrum complanatum]
MAAAAEVGEADLFDPNPDIHALFMHYNHLYFDQKLGACSVAWSSSRMTLCAGICQFVRGGGCAIRLSEPLLKYRSVADLKDTLLHEMIHAYLFLTDGNRDHDDHGPSFQTKMSAINNSTIMDLEKPKQGYHISVYHSFKDEVDNYRVHHWMCQVCGNTVKRSMNRAPSAADCRYRLPDAQACSDLRCSWHMHERHCGGNFVKTAEPAGYVDRRKRSNDGPSTQNIGVTFEASKQANGQKCKSLANAKENNTAVPRKSQLENFFGTMASQKVQEKLDSHQEGGRGVELENESGNVLKFVKEHAETVMKPIEGTGCAPMFEKNDTFHSQESLEQKTLEILISPPATNVRKRKRKVQLSGNDAPKVPTVIIGWKGWWASEDEENEEICKLVDKRRARRIHEKSVGLVESKKVNESKVSKTILIDEDQHTDHKPNIKAIQDPDLPGNCFLQHANSEDSDDVDYIATIQSDSESGDFYAKKIDTSYRKVTSHHIEGVKMIPMNFSLEQMAESGSCHHIVDDSCALCSSSSVLDPMDSHPSFPGSSMHYRVPLAGGIVAVNLENVKESQGKRERLILGMEGREQSEGHIGTVGDYPKQDITMRCPSCNKVLVGDMNNEQSNEDINKHIDECLACDQLKLS